MTAKNHLKQALHPFIYLIIPGILLVLTGCEDEECPMPDEELPTITIEDAELTIAENPFNGLALLTMTASITNEEPLEFSITSQSIAGAMLIHSTTGEITVLDSAKFDYEINPELTASITASSGDVSASADVKVVLTDIDETVDPPIDNIWKQIGQDIEGEAASDQFGWSTSLSADGTVLAVGARNNDGNGSNSGHVRVFRNNGGVWSQIGSDLDGEAAGDLAGWAISLSDDGSILAVGARLNGGSGIFAGHVRVYENVADNWVQLGEDIDADADNDQVGQSVSISGDGTRVAVGGHFHKEVGTKRGQVRVFENVSGTWSQVGEDIDGEANFDESGWSVSINQDGSVVAVGAIRNDGNGQDSGHVRVFSDESGVWNQIGEDIDGEMEKNQFGYSVSLSADGSTIAIGAPLNTVSTDHEGHVRVFRNQANEWVQIGSDIDGETAGDQSGYSLSLSADGSSVAIGSYFHANRTGQVRVFKNESDSWNQVGLDIAGKMEGDALGTSVSLSADGKILACGASIDGGGSGYVQVYELDEDI
ncbi:MAG: hypothetical protein ABJG47_10900 [Ekhidna sp.]